VAAIGIERRGEPPWRSGGSVALPNVGELHVRFSLDSAAMPPQPLIPLVASDHHLGHDGLVELVGGRPVPCFESPERATVIRRALLESGRYELVSPTDHGPDPISAVHDVELIDLVEHVWTDAVASGHDATRPLLPDTFLLRQYAGTMPLDRLALNRRDRLGAYCFDTATPIVEGTAAAADAAVDIGLTALDLVLEGARLAYGLCRPPGHHAGRNLIGGYCFFNNAAIVAQAARDRGAQRVAILDVDFHHGNGTQQIFWERDDVLYVSLHGDPAGIYPYYSGYATERGALEGEGFTLNLPLPPGTEGDAYLEALDEGLGAIRAFDADAPLVVSLGFDTYHTDPICNLALQTDDYARIGSAIASLGMPVVALQEGGYAVEALGANAVSFLGVLTGG
jgi:acetoin utilization deacetylase AcuC-like enzyme